jgi:hypothetical protein
MSDEPPRDRTESDRSRRLGCTVAKVVGIVVLALLIFSVAVPHFTGASKISKFTAAAISARGIYLGLLNYAGDHNGEFPTAKMNSNEAYRKLIPEYIDNEKPFFFTGCAWHSSNGGRQPEGIGNPPDYAHALERGENHWAYVSGLRDDSPANLPIIADGFSELIGVYARSSQEKGGFWGGIKAIVVYLDGSVKQEPLDPKTLHVMKSKPDGTRADVFSKEWGTDPTKVFNPLP